MKYLNLINMVSFFLLIPALAEAQEKLDLTICREMARQNYPKMKQVELIQKISDLKEKNNKTAYLPQMDVKGQATYQSDVTSIPIDLSRFNMEIPSVPKDQYKVYLDLKQTIWDGGMTRSRNQLEAASLESDLQKIEADVYQINGMVDTYYFNWLIVLQNEQVLSAQMEVLGKQVERLENAEKAGAAREKDIEKLKAETLLLKQKQIDLASKRVSIAEILSILTGKEIKPDAVPQIPADGLGKANELKRPEYQLFDLQQKQLLASDRLLNSTRMPSVYAFGQAGYGRPALNMLSTEFDTYYMVGVGVSWRIFDWQNVSRNKKMNSLQREVIGTVQSDFEQKQKIQLADASSQLSDLKQLIASDEEILALRKKISATASSELENGVITSTDYLSDLNSETVALINYATHKIQLVQATVNYNNILGK
ncbi:MAG TPA: TolC family protein [Prolixibacteraceae bacterium]|nr:TolC family protein [Prolixibacteraceae bacterium]HPS12150.1 TolC family protein [Prolixibacteraceae bacterium]